MAETLRPTSLAQLREIVAEAVDEGRPLEVIGGGSKRGYGRPVEAERVLALDGLSGIGMYEPNELVMSAGAGTPLAEVEAALEGAGQELAFEPADYGEISGGPAGAQTIGGVFACNLSGPKRLRSGAARDHLLGAQVVTGYGQVVVTGGRVVKNVTGYDLPKLLTGSFGTLAAMGQVTFKVLPRAETSVTLLALSQDEAALLALLRRAMGTSYDVSGAAMLPSLAAGRSSLRTVRQPGGEGGSPVAALRLEGPAPSVTYRADRLTDTLRAPGIEFARLDHDESRALWREVRDVTLLARGRCLWRLSVPPTAATDLLEWSRHFTTERLYDQAGGLIWMALSDERALEGDTMRAAALNRGSATLVRGWDWLRTRIEPFQPQPPALAALTRRVKASFDPKGVLNPGRMMSGV